MRFLFTKSIEVYRLASSSSKESYSLNGSINGYILPIGAEDAFLSEGNPAQQYKLVTDYDSDVKVTDKLTYDDGDYIVKGMQKIDFGALRRIEARLEKPNS